MSLITLRAVPVCARVFSFLHALMYNVKRETFIGDDLNIIKPSLVPLISLNVVYISLIWSDYSTMTCQNATGSLIAKLQLWQ